MLSPKQNSLYWREFSAALKAANPKPADPNAFRHTLHLQALGCDKSHTDFNNDDLSKVLSKFRSIARPDDLDIQLWHATETRRKTIHLITTLVPSAYRDHIMLDRFGHTNLDDLSDSQLTQLRNTLVARANALRRRSQQPEHIPALAAADASNCPY